MNVQKPLRLWEIVLYGTAMNLGIRWLATGAATGPVALPIWIIAGVLFLAPLVLATLALSQRFPEEGAIYAWSRETQGPLAGFLCGWFYWASFLPFFAGLLVFAVNLLGRTIGGEFGGWLVTPPGIMFASSVLICAIAAMHAGGIGVGKWMPLIGATTTIALLALIIVGGFYLTGREGSATDFGHAQYMPELNANAAILWATMIFAYGGAEGIALMSSQAKRGVRTITVAVVIIGIGLMLAYATGTAAMLTVLPSDRISRLGGLPEALEVLLQKLKIASLVPVILLGLSLAILGGLSSWFGAAARLPFAAGLSHALPPAFGRLSPKTGAPVNAIWMQAVLVIGLLVLSQAGSSVAGAYDFMIAMATLSAALPYLFMFVAWWKIADATVAKLGAAVGFAITMSAVLGSVVPSPDASSPLSSILKLLIATLVMTASGAGLYYAGTRRALIQAA
ncbi:MAG: APC family permease [Paracoccaceae bacterium]